MDPKNIVVIGASAGGFEAIKSLVAQLPAELRAAVFIVWHMSPDIRGILPQVLNRYRNLYAGHALDRESIEYGHIYVAPPDRHMLIENEHVRVTRGPKENRFRPAIDPLFRSAAYHYGVNVIGMILSGALDDGTAGLWTVKLRGGTAIVQHPGDAEVRSMPESAIRNVSVDYIVPVSKMGELLTRLIDSAEDRLGEYRSEIDANESAKTETELGIASERRSIEEGVLSLGELSPYTCPECHGTLITIRDGEKIRRFRCHTGHAFSADTLLGAVSEKIEDSLWSAIRCADESIIMLNHAGDHFAERNEPGIAALYFQKAREAQERNDLIRQTIFSQERLSNENVRSEAATQDELVERH